MFLCCSSFPRCILVRDSHRIYSLCTAPISFCSYSWIFFYLLPLVCQFLLRKRSRSPPEHCSFFLPSSTQSPEGMTPLRECVSPMQEGRKCISSISGGSSQVVPSSPFLEKRRRCQGIGDCVMGDASGECSVQHTREYEGTKLV